MKKYIWLVPLFAVILTSLCMLSFNDTQTKPYSALLQNDGVEDYDSIESIMSASTFYVKATLIQETPYLKDVSYRYTFKLMDDYAGNMRLDNEGTFSVYSLLSGQYEVGETYYLFLNAEESYMADTIMYEAVGNPTVLRYDEGWFSNQIHVDSLPDSSDTLSISPSTFEDEICEYTEDTLSTIQERTNETFISDNYPSLDSTVVAADAIWLVTIQNCEELNSNAGICEYKIEHVFRGNVETADVGSVFNGIFPTGTVTIGGQYYLLLADIGEYEYRPFTFDHWLIPAKSEESEALLTLLEDIE